jgi:hypothetical protein
MARACGIKTVPTGNVHPSREECQGEVRVIMFVPFRGPKKSPPTSILYTISGDFARAVLFFSQRLDTLYR